MKGVVTDIEAYKTRREQDRVAPFESDRKVVRLSSDVAIGGKEICVIAGPCSIESEEQFLAVISSVKESGAKAIRGGIFKPRTSPYSFQGLGSTGFNILDNAKKTFGSPIISEVMDQRMLEEMAEHVDAFQVGARNMYNYPLLKDLGRLNKPVLLKRSMMATIEEFVGAAEYILSHGNSNVILCERGIRSFDSNTRFCLDLAAISVLKEKLKQPIVVDPSHGTGVARYVEPMALAAIAAGADGIMIEVHATPEKALSDGKQALTFDAFRSLMLKLDKVSNAVGRSI
ncbi:MAG: 3-deoxy-7-phosphoheptulonate synthase [bacterium]|nr:3-deoxy-7-phosphoheptulonate synthase [bacterium]